MWTTSFRTCARQPLTTKWLNANDRANLVAIDVTVTDSNVFFDPAVGSFIPTMNTHGQAKTCVVNLFNHISNLVRFKAHNVKNRPKCSFSNTEISSISNAEGAT